jgi:S-methylmethionine-dependent homocysteine/selenocysteine methylase
MAITVLDGGMGRELHRIGAPFRQPEWSAIALWEGPDWVVQAHRNFIDAGASVITTNSYACVPFHIGHELFTADGLKLVATSGELARRAVTESVSSVLVAGSVPPLFGSYRPDLFDPDHAKEIVEVLVNGLDPWVDLWLIETTGSIVEAQNSLAAVRARPPRPVWVSFTLKDSLDKDGGAVLRSGERISDAIAAIESVDAVLFNCSKPEVMQSAVTESKSCVKSTIQIGVYANAFPVVADDREANEGLSEIRPDLTPTRYREFAQDWVLAGATIIGGCCGITPEHVAALAGL